MTRFAIDTVQEFFAVANRFLAGLNLASELKKERRGEARQEIVALIVRGKNTRIIIGNLSSIVAQQKQKKKQKINQQQRWEGERQSEYKQQRLNETGSANLQV